MVKSAWGVTLLAAAATVASAAEEVPAVTLLRSYSQMNYPVARKLAGEHPELPEAKLVSGLCDLYDRANQQIEAGQTKLMELFMDQSVPLRYRLQAGLSLARTSQLMKQRRDIYGTKGDKYDHNEIYEKILKLASGSQAARDAFFYMMREQMESPKSSEAMFDRVEQFIADFKGDRKLLPPIHLLAEYEYINMRRDYKTAVRHLIDGYELGFANPSEDRSALFRIGFFLYKKVGDLPLAVKYFNEYLKKYPFSAQAVVAQRFLNEIKAEGKRK